MFPHTKITFIFLCQKVNAFIPLTLTNKVWWECWQLLQTEAKGTEAWQGWVSKMEVSAGFVKTSFSCVWRLYILMPWSRSIQQELPCEISEYSPGEEKLWRLQMDLENQNEQSFVSCLQNCLFLLAVVLNSSKEENLRVRASKKQPCLRARRIVASVSFPSVYMVSDTF